MTRTDRTQGTAAPGFEVPRARRLRSAVGQAVALAMAAATVLVLALLLGLLAVRGGRVLFDLVPAGSLLARSQLVPMLVNLAIAMAAGAAVGWAAAAAWRRTGARRFPRLAAARVLAFAAAAVPLAQGIAEAIASGRFGPAAAGAGIALLVLAVALGLTRPNAHRGAGLAVAAVLVGALEPGLALAPGMPVPWLAVLLSAVAAAAALEGGDRRGTLRRMGAFALTAALALAVLALVESSLDWGFLENYSSSRAERAGVKAAIVGTLWVGVASMLVAVPVGIMAAVYLNEFAPANTTTTLLRASIANLAGVPSVVFGILGLALFVRLMGLGNSLVAGGLTLGLLTLPIVIVVSEEALRAVPQSMREAALGLGARRWQAVRHHVLPYALPGMLTGAILALARSMGETAPLIVIGVAAFIDFLPEGPRDPFTALPYLAYEWAQKPGEAFEDLAWAAVLVLVLLVLAGNLAAILLRDRAQRRTRW